MALFAGSEFSKVFSNNFGMAYIYYHAVIQVHLYAVWKRPTGSSNPHFTDVTTKHLAKVTQQECGIARAGIQVSCPPLPNYIHHTLSTSVNVT